MAEPLPTLDLSQLVLDHHEVLYRYAYRLTGSVPDAEDLTQQVFLVAQQKHTQLRDVGSARCWLFTILRNCYLKGFRRRIPIPATNLEFDMESIPQEVLEREIDGERLQLALDELPEQFKMVVLLFYFEERPYREIAELLEVPIGTVMSRLSRAKTHLRQRLFDDTPCGPRRPANDDGMKSSTLPLERPVVIRR